MKASDMVIVKRTNHCGGGLRIRAAISTLILVALPCFAFAEESITPERQREILNRAITAYERGMAEKRTDPVAAKALFSDAAGGFQALIAGGLRNPALEYNLGNAEYRLDNLGRAILHYRRAEQMDTTNANLRDNLRYAREQVEPRFESTGPSALERALFFWHYDIGSRTRYIALVGASVVGWTALATWLFFRRRGLVLVGVPLVLLGGFCAGSLAWQSHQAETSPAAVVLTNGQTVRLGRGESYEPALDKPLGAGVELRIRSERGEWVEIELPNGKTGWLPATAVERV